MMIVLVLTTFSLGIAGIVPVDSTAQTRVSSIPRSTENGGVARDGNAKYFKLDGEIWCQGC